MIIPVHMRNYREKTILCGCIKLRKYNKIDLCRGYFKNVESLNCTALISVSPDLRTADLAGLCADRLDHDELLRHLSLRHYQLRVQRQCERNYLLLLPDGEHIFGMQAKLLFTCFIDNVDEVLHMSL
jgi:hypothetical protein